MRNLISKFFPLPQYLRIPAMGIDISDRAIKYVALRSAHDSHLLTYGEERLEPGIVDSGAIKNEEVLTKILALIKNKTKMSFGHFSLPEEKAYIVDLTLPSKESSAEQIKNAIELHIDEYVPLEPVRAIFDFEIIESNRVALSAVDSTLAESYAQVINNAGLNVLSFELESHALARSIVPLQKRETYMIIDIGREQSNISIVVDCKVRFASSIDVGGNAISSAIMKDLNLSQDEARKIKEEEGLLRRGGGKDAFGSIVRVATVFRDEILERMSFWNAKVDKTENKVSRLFLSGGNASIPGLASYLSSGVSVPVEIGNPLVNIISFDKQIPSISKKEVMKYATALGLALRSFENNPF